MLAVKSEFFWGVRVLLGSAGVFLVGLVVGSFLNVLIYRLPRGLGFVRGGSFCPKCKKKIAWFDNIPLLSFFLLKGKCRQCESPISWRYPLVELLTGILTVLIFNYQSFDKLRTGLSIFKQIPIFNFQDISDLILVLLLVWGLIVIFFVDLEHQIIPDEIVIPLIILFSSQNIVKTVVGLQTTDYCLQQFLTAFVSFLLFFLLYLITKGKGMGFGDVKLAFLMGLVLGWPRIILAFYLAFLTGAAAGVILILRKKAKLKQKIAFGPFLALSTVISILWGEKIISFLVLLL